MIHLGPKMESRRRGREKRRSRVRAPRISTQSSARTKSFWGYAASSFIKLTNHLRILMFSLDIIAKNKNQLDEEAQRQKKEAVPLAQQSLPQEESSASRFIQNLVFKLILKFNYSCPEISCFQYQLPVFKLNLKFVNYLLTRHAPAPAGPLLR